MSESPPVPVVIEYPPHLVAVPPTVDPPDLTDLPEYLLASKFVQAYLNAVALEYQRIEQARQELLLSWFPATADTTLVFFEQMLGLAVNPPGFTITDRQQIVLAYMQAIKAEGTGTAWQTLLSNLIRGPWTYTEVPGVGVQINVAFSAAVAVPGGLAGVYSGGGTLAAGTYSYAVTANTAFGETLPSPTVQVVVGSTGEVALSWTANPAGPTTGYSVYRSVQGPADELFGGPGVFAGSTGTFGAPSTSSGVLYLIGTTSGTSLTDTGLPAGTKIVPGIDTSGAPTGQAVATYARQVTPAHLTVTVTNSG